MKTNKLLVAALLGLAVVSCSPKGGSSSALLPSKAMTDSVSYLVGVNFGSFIKGYNFGDLNYAQIEKGMKDFVNAKGDQNDPDFGKQFKVDPELLNDMFNEYLGMMAEYEGQKNLAKGEEFLAANAKKSDVKTTASGLQYTIIAEGDATKHPGPADEVLVNYKGTLIDGTVFDQSPEGEPIELTLDRVIEGWTEGIALIGEGGKITLYIPSNLAYGANGAGGVIGPNETLIFDVELVEVHPANAE